MELNNLIDEANDICDMVATDCIYTDATCKELKKIEMYCRKTYLMLRHVEMLRTDLDEDEFLTKLHAALVRDQKYVKVRDSMDSYNIDG